MILLISFQTSFKKVFDLAYPLKNGQTYQRYSIISSSIVCVQAYRIVYTIQKSLCMQFLNVEFIMLFCSNAQVDWMHPWFPSMPSSFGTMENIFVDYYRFLPRPLKFDINFSIEQLSSTALYQDLLSFFFNFTCKMIQFWGKINSWDLFLHFAVHLSLVSLNALM